MNRKKWIFIGTAALIVLSACGGYFFLKPSRSEEEKPRTEIVRSAPFIVKIRETGKLEPLISVNVKSNVEGEIARIFVREGEKVQQGDALIKLDDERIREEQIQANANLEAAKAQLDQSKQSVELTRIRQNAQLKSAEDGASIAKASLDAAKKSTIQQIRSAELELANARAYLDQDLIALNQARITERQSHLSLSRAKSRLASTRVNLTNAESELTRSKELYEKKYISLSALENAQAAEASARTTYEQTEQDVSAAEESVKSAAESIASRETGIASRREAIRVQEANLETLKESRKAIEYQAELQLQTAETELKRVRDSAEAEVKNSESALAIANANYIRAESGLKNAEERLEWTEITAPLAGSIIALVVEEGEIVQSGRSAFAQGPAIMTIADLSQMVINTYINEVDIPRIQVDQKAEIHLGAYPERVFEGRVKEISPQGIPLENVTKFEVVIEALGSPEELKPGMNADVDIIVADRQDVTQLPIETLIEKTKMIVQLGVAGSDMQQLSMDQSVDIESRSGKRYGGRIVGFNESAEYAATVFIDETAPAGLRAGIQTMSLILKTDSGKKEDETRIEDLRCLVERDRKQLVLLPVETENKDESSDRETAIKVGLRNDMSFEILEGLSVGDSVLVPDLSRLIER